MSGTGAALLAGAGLSSAEAAALPPHPLLSLLPPATLERLLTAGALDEYEKGTVLFRAGMDCDAIFLLVSGRCEVRAEDGEAGEIFGPGDLLGARALLNNEPHHTTAVVATRAVLLRLPAEEWRTLFANDPAIAGQFTRSVTAHVGMPAPPALRVRRVVALHPLENWVDAGRVAAELASELHHLHGQRVLLLQLGGVEQGDPRPVRLGDVRFGSEFALAAHRSIAAGGFEQVRLCARTEARDAERVARLVSHCGQFYDFVLLLLSPATPERVAVEALIQSDLGFVLCQPSAQNLSQFGVLRAALAAAGSALAHVRPLLFADDTLRGAELDALLATMGHTVHSVLRGFPRRDSAATGEPRFALALRRLAREIARCRVGLALSSGAAKGLAHIGVIQVLEEHGIEVDCVAGASMGAYVGSVWAYGLDGGQLEKVARETEGRWGLLRLIDPALTPRRGFLRTRRTAARLRRSIGDAHFADLLRPLRVVATHLDTLERAVFSNGEVVRAVEASIAIPGVCVPVNLDAVTYIDGGIADPLPVDVLRELGMEKIIAVNVIPPPERIRYWLDARREADGRVPRRRWLGRFAESRFNYAASGNILDTMMRAINGAQTRVAEAATREADVVLRPLIGDSVWHDFTKPQKYIAIGRSVAEAQIAELKSLVAGPPHEPPVSLRSALAA